GSNCVSGSFRTKKRPTSAPTHSELYPVSFLGVAARLCRNCVERGRELTQSLLLGQLLAGALVAVLARLLEERVRAREVLRQRGAERVVAGEPVAGRGHPAVAGLLEEGRSLAEVPGQDRGVAVLIEPGKAEAVVPEAPVAGARVERLGLDEVAGDHLALLEEEREAAAAVELAAVARLLVERLHAL